MTFNSYFINISIRLALLLATFLGIAFLMPEQNRFFTVIFLCCLIIIQVLLLFNYLNRINRNLARFLLLLTKEDTSVVMWKDQVEKTFRGVHHSFRKVNEEINRIRMEKEQGHILLQNIVDHIRTGILAVDQGGITEVVNEAALAVLGTDRIKGLVDLDRLQEGLTRSFEDLKYESGNIFEFRKNAYETTSLMVCASRFLLGERDIRLYSIQPIENELEAREIDSWQKMTRVLAHEISNSVTPISTLASGIHRKLSQSRDEGNDRLMVKGTSAADLLKSAELIQQRGNALVDFVEHYKSFTRIPEPDMKKVKVDQIFSDIKKYFSEDLEQKQINLDIELEKELPEIYVDQNLLEQALINLLRNSAEALADSTGGQIGLKAIRHERNSIILQVSDNGSGIPEEIQPMIFIPFYTTRPKGSGIGLAITKKIIHLQGGSIHFTSISGEGTTFMIRLGSA